MYQAKSVCPLGTQQAVVSPQGFFFAVMHLEPVREEVGTWATQGWARQVPSGGKSPVQMGRHAEASLQRGAALWPDEDGPSENLYGARGCLSIGHPGENFLKALDKPNGTL